MLKVLKEDEELRDVPVVVVSIVADVKKGASLGAADSLMKPVDRAKLLELVAKHVPGNGPDQ